jgi:peroxiredoxin
MKRILMAIMAAVALCGCIKDRYVGADLKVGDFLPDFEVVMNDGRLVTDDALRETVSVVMFFHTSCPDCQKTLPEMQKVYDGYLQKGVSFALVSREESEPSIASFWEQKALEMPYSAQSDRKVYQLFASELIPRVYICEKGGKIRYIFTDDPNPSYEDIKSALEEIIR